jgi:hypothetical protein
MVARPPCKYTRLLAHRSSHHCLAKPTSSHILSKCVSPLRDHRHGNLDSYDCLSSPDTPATPSTVLISQLPEYPRLLFSIRIDENVKPIDLSIEFVSDWLRELPISSGLVRVEAEFASNFTLLIPFRCLWQCLDIYTRIPP